MKTRDEAIYKSPEELEIVVKELEAAAAVLPPGMARRSVLIDIARLRSYAQMKRLLAMND